MTIFMAKLQFNTKTYHYWNSIEWFLGTPKNITPKSLLVSFNYYLKNYKINIPIIIM